MPSPISQPGNPGVGGVPASLLFPANFNGGKPDWIFEPKNIKEGESRKFYIASAIESGYRYYTLNREVRLSREYPENWEAEIGYKFKHGPGKVDAEGKPTEDKATPSGLWLVRAWLVEEAKMVALIIESYPLQLSIQQAIASNDEFLFLDSGLSNFYLTIFHNRNPAQKALTYTAQSTLRVSQNSAAYEAAAEDFHPDQYFKGLNPFEAPAEADAAATRRFPASARDENGADLEATIAQQESTAW
jgi:hypothetical protein